MACPKCGCKVTYHYDRFPDGIIDDELFERCSACGEIFDIEMGLDDDDDDV